MSVQYQRIYISRTKREWELIDRKIKELNFSELNSYLRSKLRYLESEYDNCPDCICSGVGKNIQKQIYLMPEQFEILNRISTTTNIPEGVIVNRLIIEPLIIGPHF